VSPKGRVDGPWSRTRGDKEFACRWTLFNPFGVGQFLRRHPLPWVSPTANDIRPLRGPTVFRLLPSAYCLLHICPSRQLRRSSHPDFVFGCHDKATRPLGYVFFCELICNPCDYRPPTGVVHTNQQDAMVCSGSEALRIGKIHILGYQETCFILRSLPDDWIGFACDSLLHNGMDVVAHCSQPWRQERGQVFIEFDLH